MTSIITLPSNQLSSRLGQRHELFVQTCNLPCSAETAFAWHEQPGALQRLLPAYQPITVVQSSKSLREGSQVHLRIPIGGMRWTWVAEHRDYIPGRLFRDVQLRGPFRSFDHRHEFLPLDSQSCVLRDEITWSLWGGAWLQRRMKPWIERELSRMFRYRHAVLKADMEQRNRQIHAGVTMKRILITGATGLVGTELTHLLTTQGFEVYRLTRRDPQDARDIPWNPERQEIFPARLEGMDAVIHLAGENISAARWTPTFKEKIRRSRVAGTQLLCTTLSRLERKPSLLLSASAIGYYGDRGVEILHEDSAPGTGFLPEVCQAWEQACDPARDAGIRVVCMRIGVVLSPRGGALHKMLPAFRWGVGGVIGSGQQYMSWIALDDVAGAIWHLLQQPAISGPVNLTAPHPVTNREFTRVLSRVLHRPAVFPLPAFAAKLALGEMAEELLLSSTRVEPTKLLHSGYVFRHPTLEEALCHLLGIPGPA
ncbi:MAG: hypothetical protein KatS3mg113_0547 [Planctomycetaceae bacterium]|nr:MAG: hypothetical protein KatS3mg113_0547 [Planctomycetaceae bacterium]